MESGCVLGVTNSLCVGRCFLSAWFIQSWNLSLAFRHPPICKWKRLSSLLAITAYELQLQCHNKMLVFHMSTIVLMHLKQQLVLILPRPTCPMVPLFNPDIHIPSILHSFSLFLFCCCSFVYPCNNILLLCHQTLYKNIMLLLLGLFHVASKDTLSVMFALLPQPRSVIRYRVDLFTIIVRHRIAN